MRSIALIAFCAVANAANLKPALQLRGGLAGLDSTTVATVGASLFCANGIYCGIAPGPASEAYGLKDASFEVTQVIKYLGYTFVAFSILALAVLKGVSVNRAIAWAQVPWILVGLDNIWNGIAKKLGQPDFAPFLLLAINCATAYCGFTDTSMPLAATLNAAWCGLNGVFFALKPDKGAEAWGMKADAKFEAMMKNMGYALTACAVLTYYVANGADITTAIGYAFVPTLLSIIDQLLVSKGFETLGADPAPAYVWGAIQMAVIAGTLA